MRQFLQKNFRWIAGGFALTFFSSIGQTFFISASVAEWQLEFGLSHGEFGRLYMFATLGSAACLPFFGRLIDLLPAHRLILIVVPVLAGASLLAGFAATVPLLVIAIFMLRLFGQGYLSYRPPMIELKAVALPFEAKKDPKSSCSKRRPE